jgi:uncharacterized protein YybS (DUF2232 family)
MSFHSSITIRFLFVLPANVQVKQRLADSAYMAITAGCGQGAWNEATA